MNNTPSTIEELFNNWQDGRTIQGRVISNIARYHTDGLYHLEFADQPMPYGTLAYAGVVSLDPNSTDLDSVFSIDHWLRAHPEMLIIDRSMITESDIDFITKSLRNRLSSKPIGEPPTNPNSERQQLTKAQAVALGFEVRPYTIVDHRIDSISTSQRWYLVRDGNVYANGVYIEKADLDQLRDHFDSYSLTAEGAWQFLPLINSVTGAIIDPLE